MFFNKLLVAVDDSAPSQYAIEIALVVAKRDACPIVFCVVLDPALLAQNYGYTSMCELAEGMANDILNAAMQRAQTAGVQASSKTIYRNAAQGIIDVAGAQDVDMIVMGTHGRTGFARALLRSVAEEVLRRTTTPLCVIRRPPIEKIYGRFVVPICDDDLGKAATQYAIELARNFDSSLLFCTVTNGSDAYNAARLVESAKETARQNAIQSDGCVLESRESISDTIVHQAGIDETDAIIMATHGRDGFMRLVKGSVTEAVIRSSLIPVVVIR